MNHEDYYKILQVDPAAEPEVIAAAYKRLAQKYHPDARIGSTEDLHMQELNTAYAVLSNPGKRAQYDRIRSARAIRSTYAPATERFEPAAIAIGQQHTAPSHRHRSAQAPGRGWSLRRMLLALVCIGVLLGSGTAAILSQRGSEALPQAASNIWEGECLAPAGYIYACRVRIRINSTNRVTGSVVWTLKVSPHADEQLAIGRKARASIRGSFDPASRRMTIESSLHDDPYAMIDVNKYILWLSADEQMLSGETYADGTWYGTLLATRKE